jgi:hypothetical protein
MNEAARAKALLAIIVAFAPVACRGQSQRQLELTDTEGRTFAAGCDREGRCKLERKSGSPVSPDRPELVLQSPGLVVAICDVAPATQQGADSDCRPLTCKTDAECPPSSRGGDGTCINGLCIEPSGAIGVADAVMLCLAGTGLGRSKPNQVDRYAMALNCGTPCRVPAPCRQP